MPSVVNRSHVGVLTPLYTGINSENFNSRFSPLKRSLQTGTKEVFATNFTN